MDDGTPQWEFGRPRTALAKAFGLTAVGAGVLAVVAGAWVWHGAYPLRLTLLVVVGVPITALGVYLLRAWLPPYRLVIGANGVELRHRGSTVVLPWTDMEYWWLGFPSTAAGGRKGAGRLCLLARPAPHVTDPGAGPRGAIWAQDWQRWVICEPDLTDQSRNEVGAAMRQHAGRLEAHVVRGDASPAAGEVDGDAHTTVGPTTVYPPKITNAAAIGLVVVGFLSVVGGDLVTVAGGVALVVLLLGVAMLSFAEAGYLWWQLRQHRTMTVTDYGVELRTRGHAATIPWSDVARWTVGTGPQLSTTFFMSARRAPNPAVRVPVRDVVLAVPAEHVTDPTAGGLRSSWSRRHGAWVLCRVTHTNATTDEVVSLLRRFSPEKESV